MNQPGVQPANQEVWFDRKAEVRCLHATFRQRASLLIFGPAGAGKTALVAKVLSELPEDVRRSTFYLSGIEGLQPLLRALLLELFEAEDPTLRRQLQAEGVRRADFEIWVKNQPTSRLKGALYRSVENGHYWIFLDHLPPLTHAVAKVVKEVVRMRNTPVYLLARGFTEQEVGHLSDLYWSDRERLVLPPLPEPAARELLESCIQRFGLSQLNLTGFREEILRLSVQIPGAIVKMCALAAQPRYRYGSQIKTKLVHIDYLISGHDFAPGRSTLQGHFQL